MRRLAVLLLLATVAVACGRKSDPLPPLSFRPQPVADLEAWQDGSRVVLRATWPTTTEAGRTLDEIREVEVRRNDSDGWRPVATLSGTAITAATRGAKFVWSEILTDDTLRAGVEAGEMRYAIVVTGEERSDVSNVARVAPRPLAFAPEFQGAKLDDGDVAIRFSPRNDLGVLVYRRRDGAPEPLDPQATVEPGTIEFVDRRVPLGCWIYRLAADLGEGSRGPRGPEILVDVIDATPPPAPEEIDLFREPTRVRLLWRPVTAADLVAYVIERADTCDGDFREIGRTEDPSFTDAEAAADAAWCYRVRSLDESGNSSEPSPPAVAEPF